MRITIRPTRGLIHTHVLLFPPCSAGSQFISTTWHYPLSPHWGPLQRWPHFVMGWWSGWDKSWIVENKSWRNILKISVKLKWPSLIASSCYLILILSTSNSFNKILSIHFHFGYINAKAEWKVRRKVNIWHSVQVLIKRTHSQVETTRDGKANKLGTKGRAVQSKKRDFWKWWGYSMILWYIMLQIYNMYKNVQKSFNGGLEKIKEL